MAVQYNYRNKNKGKLMVLYKKKFSTQRAFHELGTENSYDFVATLS